MKKKPAKKVGKPILVECEECCGSGEVEAQCEMCGDVLTNLNVADDGSDSLCQKCAKEEGW